MAEQISNNIKYNEESNYRHYYRQIFSKNLNSVILGIPQLPKTLPVSALDVRWVIEKQYEYRLDMIARKWYNKSHIDMMWIIMLYNLPETTETVFPGIQPKIILPEMEQAKPPVGVHPFKDFPAGREIYIPARSTIEDFLI